MAKLQSVMPWVDKYLLFDKDFIASFRWIYAPSLSSLIFALRTTFASFIALAIALWMELDSPQWAPMTVWIVARNTSRGETISKAYWRVVGTMIGAVCAVLFVSAFPQQPMLFDIVVCAFVAGCCWFATSMRNFKAYAMVLAGYTCAIIAFGSLKDPDGVFLLAMSRATYIILGVMADDIVGRFFDFNLDKNARKQLSDNLLGVIEGAVKAISDMIAGDELVSSRSNELFSSISTINNNLEFIEVEMQGNDHTGDHAYAALSSVTAILSRAMGLSIHLRSFRGQSLTFAQIIPSVQHCLNELLVQIQSKKDLEFSKRALGTLRWECRQRITDSFFHSNRKELLEDNEQKTQFILNDRILYRSLSELLGELQVTLEEYQKSVNPKPGDTFRFLIKSRPNYRLAWQNTVRSFVAAMGACLLWEVTAWDQGAGCISLLCMGCARFCLFENPSLVCKGWLRGSLWAIAASGILVFLFLPVADTIEMLWLILFIPTLLGGLGIAHHKTLPIAASYAPYFFFLFGFDNQNRMNEITFFNSACSLLVGIFFSIFAFTVIYPYDPIKIRRHLRETLLKGMHQLADTMSRSNPRFWLSYTSEAFITIMRQLQTTKNTPVVQAYSQGTTAVMMIGINVIRLHSMIDQGVVSEDIKILLRIVLRRISKFSGRYGRTVTVAHNVIRKLRQREGQEPNLSIRMEIIAAVSCLTIISDGLDRNAQFLDITHPFHSLEEWGGDKTFQ